MAYSSSALKLRAAPADNLSMHNARRTYLLTAALALFALLLAGYATHELCSALSFQDWGCAQPCTR
jgi:hypothetical protein